MSAPEWTGAERADLEETITLARWAGDTATATLWEAVMDGSRPTVTWVLPEDRHA